MELYGCFGRDMVRLCRLAVYLCVDNIGDRNRALLVFLRGPAFVLLGFRKRRVRQCDTPFGLGKRSAR